MEKAIVCFSGGHASALTAVEAVRKYGKDRVMLINHNISNHVEHQDIKRFKQDVSSYLDVPITYANAEDYEEMTPLAVMRKKGGNSARLVHCTMYLKIDPFHKWLKANYPATHKNPCNSVSILYGFDAKETERIYYRREMFKGLGYNTEYPLALWRRTISEIEDVGIRAS